MKIEKKSFGHTPEGEIIDLYTLTNDKGLRLRVTPYGAIVVALETPDRRGRPADIVLGYDSLAAYLKDNPYFGCVVGRFANRIAGGRFHLDGVAYQLAQNDGGNHLHGGLRGFDKVVWQTEELSAADSVGLRFRYTSPDGEEGYPGELSVTLDYALTNANEFKIAYEAATDKATVLNLTHHTYFNLTGCSDDILGHEIAINADRFTPVDDTLIPTGEIEAVAGTPMDLRKSATIGAAMAQLRGVFDHNYVLARKGGGLELAATVREPKSGRILEIFTTEPGIQFYSGNFLDGHHKGKGGVSYRKHFGLCLETQHFPDSPNQPAFPTTVLRPGQTFRSMTTHRFSVK
jgi:aldose 1-epimerase